MFHGFVKFSVDNGNQMLAISQRFGLIARVQQLDTTLILYSDYVEQFGIIRLLVMLRKYKQTYKQTVVHSRRGQLDVCS